MTFWINVLIAILGAALLTAQIAASALPASLRKRFAFLSKKRWSIGAMILVGVLMLLAITNARLDTRAEAHNSAKLAAAGKQRDDLSQDLTAAKKQRDELSKNLAAAKKQRDDLTEDLVAAEKQRDDLSKDLGAAKKQRDDLLVGLYAATEQTNVLSRALGAVEKHNKLGMALQAEGDFDAAIEHYEAALLIDPKDATTHYNLGMALQAQGDLDAAIQHYEAALRVNPNSARIHKTLGDTLLERGDVDGAIKHRGLALQIDPSYVYSELAREKQAAGELDYAIELYEITVSLTDPNAPKSAKYFAHLAIARVQRAIALDQKRKTRASLAELAGPAVEALARAIELDPRYRDTAKSDADYDPIRDVPAFRKLVYGE